MKEQNQERKTATWTVSTLINVHVYDILFQDFFVDVVVVVVGCATTLTCILAETVPIPQNSLSNEHSSNWYHYDAPQVDSTLDDLQIVANDLC